MQWMNCTWTKTPFKFGMLNILRMKLYFLKIRKAQKLFSEKDKWDEYLMRTDIKSKVWKGYIKYAVEDQEHLMRP